MTAPQSDPSGSSTVSSKPPRRGWLWWLSAAIALFAGGVAGLLQPPRPDPFQVITPWTSLDWWQYPIERNAFKRLPVIDGMLNDVFTLPDKQHVWAVGNGGLIVHSSDGGKTWQQQTNIRLAGETAQEPQPGARPTAPAQPRIPEPGKTSSGFELLPAAHAAVEVEQKAYPQKQQPGGPAGAKGSPASSGKKAASTQRTPPAKPDANAAQSAVQPPREAPRSIAEIDLHSVQFVDANRGWTVGTYGTILVTSDGGKNWSSQTSNASVSLRALAFLDAMHGVIVGDEGTIRLTQNGGQTWSTTNSHTAANLRDVDFVDASRASAVGGAGTILLTQDAGRTWTEQVSNTRAALSSVHFIDALRGWAVGDQTALATKDGGRSWETQTRNAPTILSSVYFIDAVHGWAVGGAGVSDLATIVATNDAGKTWVAQPGWHFYLNAIQFVDGQHGRAVGWGIALVTNDGGRTWMAESGDARSRFNSVHFSGSTRGWLVGDQGSILSTDDGGNTWTAQHSGSDKLLYSVHFVDGSHGWVSGSGGTILFTENAGRTWRAQPSGSNAALASIYFTDPMHGWVVGIGTREAPTEILSTQNGGRTWERDTASIKQFQALTSVRFSDPSRGWAVGSDGALLSSDGKNWTLGDSGTDQWLRSVDFPDPMQGRAVGNRGTIITTEDGGAVWKRQASPTRVHLYGVRFSSVNRGWAVGNRGTILSTEDSGSTWVSQSSNMTFALLSLWADAEGKRLCAVGLGTILNSSDGGKTWRSVTYAKYPAPWVWGLWLFSIAAGARAWRSARNALPEEKERSIEDKAASDAPVEVGEQDRLNFEPIAKALAKFLQNQSTTAPLVLAVTGKWGTGKSSLMNLLRSELRGKFGVRSVWFNAWHHQNEENLLAALLENIRQQAVPSLYSTAGWAFRVQLAWTRYKRRLWSSTILLAVLVAAAGYVATAPQLRWEQFVGWIKMLTTDVDKLDGSGALSGVSGIAIVLVLAKVLFSLRAFGVNPAALMATTASQFKLRDASAQAGFRFQFQREFDEVTSALERIDRRMLIFIDDLDRCQPQAVTQILEAVNFLTSSGKCYIVLGMDRDYVERAVGLGFQEIAKEMAEQKAQDADGKAHRQQFAQRYMKKLLNLEIPIPSLDATLAEQLFEEQAAASPALPARIRWPSRSRRWLTAQLRWAPLALVVLIVASAWMAGKGLNDWFAVTEQPKKEDKVALQPGMAIQWELETKSDGKMLIIPKVVGETKLQEKPVETRAIAVTEPIAPPTPTQREPSSGAAVFEEGQTAKTPWSWPLPFLIALLVLAAYLIWRSPDAVVRDSEAFNKALDIWKRLVIAKSPNPREIKRFQNRVRYFAMRLRDDRERKVVSQQTQQTEAMLVALAALHHAVPEFVGDALLFADSGTKRLPEALTSHQFPALVHMTRDEKDQIFNLWALLRQCLDEHRLEKMQWPPPPDVVDRFKRWSEGIVT